MKKKRVTNYRNDVEMQSAIFQYAILNLAEFQSFMEQIGEPDMEIMKDFAMTQFEEFNRYCEIKHGFSLKRPQGGDE